MNPRITALLFGSLMIFVGTIFADLAVAEPIRFTRQSDTLFLNCEDVAAALKFDFKVVSPQRLATFCQGGPDGICIPVRLTSDNHRRLDTDLFVDTDALSRALRFRLNDAGDTVTIEQRRRSDNDRLTSKTPAYNANWDQGRGFGKGDTLPDIPLVDLHGNEVRFSRFLGKRYILYCWASW